MARAAEAAFDHGRYRAARRVTVVGAVVNLLLTAAKIVVGWLAHSQALIADGIHSLSDLASDAVVLLAARHASREADQDHPYGHRRIETLATVVLGAALIAVGLGLAIDAGRRIFAPDLLLRPGAAALAVALVSVASKEWLYRYTLRAAQALRSDLLRANAWHHRTDAISSLVVLAGVGGTMAGFPYLDAVAAIGVAGFIVRIGWELAFHSVRELIDTGLEPERLAAIRRAILAVDGVRSLHMLRTRRMGPDALVDVHIQVDPRLSVSEGHQIGETVRRRLIEEVEEVADVTVHVDPEDDAQGPLGEGLPLRAEVLERLGRRWAEIPAARRIDEVTLHYLDGKIHVDVLLPLAAVRDHAEARRVASALRAAARELPELGEVRIHFH